MFFKVVTPLLAVVLVVSDGGILGGPMDADLNTENVQNALKFAVAQHNRRSNDAFISQVSRVIKAQQQVVSGVKYIFTVEMVRTSCRKGGVAELCSAHSDPAIAQPHQCRLAVWSQVWTGTIKLVENTC